MNESGAKQQIVEKIKGSSNILVTVSTGPSVDELSSALGLTLLLNKMKKHATAVFSGAIPPAITFLDPEKTFENTVDSLRDFIIALDKEKADHLRYKVEGDVVKIFITPYRTTITGEDLEFSQGDYNVELVLALGVKNQDHLDSALAAHGKILHDAAVVTISAGGEKSNLGSTDWREENASSLSEMLVSLSDALKSDKALLDEQISTAFLTGIVAATDRFSNNRTSSKVMSIAAQLMAAGANQQLIASKLEEAHEINNPPAENGDPNKSDDTDQNSDGTTDLSEGESTKLSRKQAKEAAKKDRTPTPEEKPEDGSLLISHEKEGGIDEVAKQTAAENQTDSVKLAEQNLAEQLASVAPAAAATPTVAELKQDLEAANAQVEAAAEQPPAAASPAPLSGAVSSDIWKKHVPKPQNEPIMGGTLNATAEEAAEKSRRDIDDDRNRTILSHNNGKYVGDSTPTYQPAFNATTQTEDNQVMIDPMQDPAGGSSAVTEPSQPTSVPRPIVIQPPAAATLADIDLQNRAPHYEARAAIDAAFSQPQAASEPPAVPLPPLPPLPDFSTLPPLPHPGDFAAPASTSENLLPPTPTVSSTPPNDPGQFKIPGQS